MRHQEDYRTMHEPTKQQQLRILLALAQSADGEGAVELMGTDVYSTLEDIFPHVNYLPEYLFQLSEQGVIHYEEVGEDGFAPIRMCSIDEKTWQEIDALATEIEHSYGELETRLTDLIAFDPAELSHAIQQTKESLDEVDEKVRSNEILSPIAKPIDDIRSHFESVKLVADRYDDVYKNIVKPVRVAAESGVRTTVRWAIFSIVLSAVVTIILSNMNEGSTEAVHQQTASSVETSTSLPRVSLSNDEVLRRLDQLQSHLLFSANYSVSEGERFVQRGEHLELSDGDNEDLKLYLDSITDWPKGEGIKAGFKMYKNDKQLGTIAFRSLLQRADNQSGPREWFEQQVLVVAQGDKLRIGTVQLEILSIFSKKPMHRIAGDERDGVKIRVTEPGA